MMAPPPAIPLGAPIIQPREESTMPQAPPLTTHGRAKALISLQSFEGSFPLTQPFASILEVSLADLQTKLAGFVPVGTPPEEDKEKLWATVLAVFMFRIKLKGESDMWELVVEKALNWISGLLTVGKNDVDRLDAMAREVLGE